MTSKVIGWVCLIFFFLVGLNYLSLTAGNFLSYRLASADEYRGTGSGLTSINFSFFGKNGVGRSYITQGYGRTPFAYLYKDDWHNGIDIAAVYGAPIYSPGGSVVLATGNQDDYCYHLGFGKFVAVEDNANHLVLWFAHLGTIAVSPGESVKKGTLLGTVGQTGFETGIHLHFSIFDADGFSMMSRNGCGPDATGKDLDPLSYLGTTYQ